MIGRIWYIWLTGLLLSIGLSSYATHNRAGEITFRHIQGTKYEIKVITYTDPTSPPDRERLTVRYDDGTSDEIPRVRIDPNIGEDAQYPIDRNVYKATHDFPGPGTYTIRMQDPNRVADIENVRNSVNTEFYIESELKIPAEALGNNSSVELLQPPIDYAETGQVFVHYPNAYDPDGDSIAYSFTTPRRAKNEPVSGYYLPYAENNFSIDEVTGRVEWDYPDSTGIFNIAIQVEEFRNGRKIGEVVRDMQIIVTEGENVRPDLIDFKDTCIVAGSDKSLSIPVKAFDTTQRQIPSPSRQQTTLTATGGPFEVANNKAVFREQTSSFQVNSRFTWDVTCNHIKKFPYQVVFKARDDHPDDQFNQLADLKNLRIKVIGPEPENLTADPKPKGIDLKWDLPACENVKGYYVYRRVDSSNWSPDRCQTGVPGDQGFERIDTITNNQKTTYFDDKAVPGTRYCYRVSGIYINEGRYNWTEGRVSNETCARLQRDVPVITHVDVTATGTDTGSIFMDWSKPIELNSATYEPPYTYKVFQSTGMEGGDGTLVKTVSGINSFKRLVNMSTDTFYRGQGLNTKDNAYSYNVELYASSDSAVGDVFVGDSRNNSSVYLSLQPDHKMIRLSWDADVLWENEKYVIFRKSFRNDSFSAYDTVRQKRYADTQLVKDSSYCYYVQTIGSFSAKGFPDPTVNTSQINCSAPIDTIAPCPPQLSGRGNCDLRQNELDWDKPLCKKDSNIAKYNIYYRSHRGKPFQKVNSEDGGNKTEHTDDRDTLVNSIAGCYAVTALDKYGNESRMSNSICTENCPEYELPNVFTPNGDGKNDVFRPKKGWRFVDQIRFKVYNRWGTLVYETTDPEIRWDGTSQTTNEDLSSGTYFYEATIFLNELNEEPSRTISGTLQLLR